VGFGLFSVSPGASTNTWSLGYSWGRQIGLASARGEKKAVQISNAYLVPHRSIKFRQFPPALDLPSGHPFVVNSDL